MNQEINNQTPLYRFVSMRSAELSKNTDIKKRFVFYPKVSDEQRNVNVFFKAIKDKTASQTKMAALVSVCPGFSTTAFGSKQDVEKDYPVYDEIADWITRNRANLNTAMLLEKLDELVALPIADQIKLWDNLFYQIVTQADFYVKETILQLLVLQNILLAYTPDADFAASLPTLVNAKVVLPTEIFEETPTTASTSAPQRAKAQTAQQKTIENTKFQKAKQIVTAESAVANAQGLIAEINQIISAHNDDYQTEYAESLKTYQQTEKTRIAAQIASATTVALDSTLNSSTTAKKIILSDDDVPSFTFSKPAVPTVDLLTSKLTPTSLTALSQLISVPTTGKLPDIISALDTVINTNINTIVVNKPHLDDLIVLGGTVIPASNTNISENFTYQIVTTVNLLGKAKIHMNIQLPNPGFVIKTMYYTLGFKGGANNTNGYFNPLCD